MLRFHIAVICPVMEYAAPVWHTGLTAELAEGFESVQKRALRMIFGGSFFCESLAKFPFFSVKDKHYPCLFHKILEPSCGLHYLIPTKRSINQLKKNKEPLVILPVIHTYQTV